MTIDEKNSTGLANPELCIATGALDTSETCPTTAVGGGWQTITSSDHLTGTYGPIAIVLDRSSATWMLAIAWMGAALGIGRAVLWPRAPKPVADDVCCRPPDVTPQAWAASHTDPVLWFAAGAIAGRAARAAAPSWLMPTPWPLPRPLIRNVPG